MNKCLLEGFPLQSHEFLTSIAGATGAPFIPRNNVTVLNNGDEFYAAMLEAIAHAEKTITMETYIFWNSGIGRRDRWRPDPTAGR